MSLKLWIKARFADPALRRLRDDILSNIPAKARVLDIGCGTGDLLIRGAEHVRHGIGADIDSAMVHFANARAEQLPHIHFVKANGLEMQGRFDVVTLTLCLHTMPTTEAIPLLQHMLTLAPQVHVADFIPPKPLLDRITLELDELISGHYKNFCSYRRLGGIEPLAAMAGAQVVTRSISSLPSIGLWQLQSTTSCNARLVR